MDTTATTWAADDADTDADICAICLDAIDVEREAGFQLQQCGHSFHIVCIRRWERKCKAPPRCPMCRVVFNSIAECVDYSDDDDDDDAAAAADNSAQLVAPYARKSMVFALVIAAFVFTVLTSFLIDLYVTHTIVISEAWRIVAVLLIPLWFIIGVLYITLAILYHRISP